MSPSFTVALAFVLGLAIVPELINAASVKVVNVGIGDHCALGAAPVGPGGSWQIVEKDVKKVCADGTSCRNGACNCDDLPDGTVMGMSVDDQGNRACKRVAEQKCNKDGDCFQDVQCLKGVCTCDMTKKDFYCVDTKNDVTILA